MKYKTLLLLLLVPFLSKTQTLDEAKETILNIFSLEQLDSLRLLKTGWVIYEEEIEESDTLEFPNIKNAKIGDIFLKYNEYNKSNFVIKILGEEKKEFCNVKYIFLDGKVLSYYKIDSIRYVIIDRYKNGEDFETLVQYYTMDGNETGDTNWFSEGMMVDEFDKAVRNRKKGDIFTVDIYEKDWYYVVLKAYSNKVENVKNVVSIKYSIK